MRTLLKHSFTLIVTIAIAVGCALYSCNTNGCTDNRSSIPLAEFYSSSTLNGITLDSLEIYGIDATDTIPLLSAGSEASQVYLPMRSTTSTTSWVLAYRWHNLNIAGIKDTLSFDYDAEPWFATDECGAMYRYRINSVNYTTNIIDSVGIVDSLITNIDCVDMKIYFRTEAAESNRSSKIIKR